MIQTKCQINLRWSGQNKKKLRQTKCQKTTKSPDKKPTNHLAFFLLSFTPSKWQMNLVRQCAGECPVIVDVECLRAHTPSSASRIVRRSVWGSGRHGVGSLVFSLHGAGRRLSCRRHDQCVRPPSVQGPDSQFPDHCRLPGPGQPPDLSFKKVSMSL